MIVGTGHSTLGPGRRVVQGCFWWQLSGGSARPEVRLCQLPALP